MRARHPVLMISTLALAALFNSAIARANEDISPQDYLVFSGTSIGTAQSPIENGDYQGSTGALGNIDVSHFSFASDVTSGGSLTITDGGVEYGNVSVAGRYIGIRAHVNGWVRENDESASVSSLRSIWDFFVHESDELSSEAATGEPLFQNGSLTFNATPGFPTQVFTVSESTFRSAHSLSFNGGPQDLFVVNVEGSFLAMDGVAIHLSPWMRAGQVILNFPQAENLYLTHSPDPALGYPATFLAPHAAVTLTEAKITGGLYAGAIQNGYGCGDTQVNYAEVRWPGGCGCTRPEPGHSD